MSSGVFITVEGVEGVGKTTAIRVITDYILQHSKKQIIATREPGGTVYCEKIRNLFTHDFKEDIDVDTEVLLLFASRNQHIKKLIYPSLQKGLWVICDRYYDATHAYQVASGVNSKRIVEMEQWLTELPIPDLTFYLDAPLSVCNVRLNARKSKDRIEKRSQTYFTNVKKNYLDRVKGDPDRFCVIAADNSLEEVHAAIESRLAVLLKAHA